MSRVLAVLVASSWLATAGWAEDFPGGESPSVDEFEKGFGEKQGMTEADKRGADEDRLKIGGTLWSEFQFLQLDLPNGPGNLFSNPNNLWLYFDSRLKNDLRGFVKLRQIYDPTVSVGGINPLSGKPSARSQSDLEEAKLQLSAKKTVFFTIGKQKIKWGSGKFWNPTDFLNSDRRNFLYQTDLRSGVSLIKTHVPVAASNFYLVQGLDDANRLNQLRHAVRAEVPIGSGEVAASVTARKGALPRYGLDFSTALFDFDVYGEAAYSGGNQKTFFGPAGSYTDSSRSDASWVVGLSYELAYSEKDTFTVAGEYFYNGLGYGDPSQYGAILFGGGYEPFYLGKQYGMLMFYLPNPGDWNHTTISVFNLANLTDKSMMSRIDLATTAIEDLTVDVAVGIHYGSGSGEFKFGGQLLDFSGRLVINF